MTQLDIRRKKRDVNKRCQQVPSFLYSINSPCPTVSSQGPTCPCNTPSWSLPSPTLQKLTQHPCQSLQRRCFHLSELTDGGWEPPPPQFTEPFSSWFHCCLLITILPITLRSLLSLQFIHLDLALREDKGQGKSDG